LHSLTTIATSSFLDALTGDLPFIRNALIAGLIASASFGVVGTYVVARRISYIAASIAHSVLGGIGAALYFQRAHGITWLHPILGALVAALLAALVIGLVSLYAEEREDTIIGAIWATGMAIGLLFLHFTPPPAVDAMSYFFGDILIISHSELIAVSLRLTAVTVVLLVTLVGIILAIALLTIPAAIASRFASRLWQMMLLSVILSAVFISGGLGVSFQAETPTGPTIIIFAAAAYFISLLGSRLWKKRES
jgi:zinc transport system permease protein